MLERQFSTLQFHFWWQVQHLVMLQCQFSWPAQHLVMLERHFSWQAQHLVKFASMAGARNAVFSSPKCVAEGEKVSSANGRVQFCNFMLGSWPDHARTARLCK